MLGKQKLGGWLVNEGVLQEETFNRGLITLGIIVFRVLLDVSYPMIICTAYSVYGFIYNPDLVKIILSYVAMLVVLAVFVPQVQLDRPASILLLLVMIMAYVPNMALFAGMGLTYSFFIMSNLFWLSVSLFYYFAMSVRLSRYLRLRFVLRNAIYLPFGKNWILYMAFFLVLIYSINYNHGFSFSIGLREAYDLRLSARGNIGRFFTYLLSWSGSIIFPTGVLLAVKQKNPVLLTVMLLGEVAAYSVTGTKTWLFAAVLAFFAAVFIRKNSRIALLSWIMAFMVAVGLLMGTVHSIGDFFNNYFTRRSSIKYYDKIYL